ncbi:hypothetical protein [Inhella proteolytica]|uniref:Helicase n=1 Tax=Inhella proteolytica TaxID=2795029 RepID=A0A931J9U6_9BURK|nr:hypothetical protein [Inhella proteolytica]MBH9579447.1 hypothetical protein [Inhella proteolytica]
MNHPPPLPPPDVLTVQIGGVDKAELLQRLAAAQVKMNLAGQQLFADERFRTAAQPEQIQVQQISVADLGLPDGGVMAQILAAAAGRGLQPCPLELGPHLRLLLDQAEGALGFAPTRNQSPPGAITVVSAPLCEDDAVPKGFYLRRIEGVLWLRGYWSSAEHVRRPDEQLVFAYPATATITA